MKRLVKHILSYFPEPLPVGMSQFEQWSNGILELSGRFADVDSMRFALASMVIHADAKHGYLPKRYFVVRLRKVAANQVSSQVFQDIKLKQQAAVELAAKQQAEATATSQESCTSDDKKAD